MSKIHNLISEMIMDSGHDRVNIVASRPISGIEELSKFGVDIMFYGIDPEYEDHPAYTVCDIIFDEGLEFDGLIVHMNCQKTYPIGKLYSGEFILVGHESDHPGDRNQISTCQQLIEQNNLIEVYSTLDYMDESRNILYHVVWGRNA